jgi:hypothetical protein
MPTRENRCFETHLAPIGLWALGSPDHSQVLLWGLPLPGGEPESPESISRRMRRGLEARFQTRRRDPQSATPRYPTAEPVETERWRATSAETLSPSLGREEARKPSASGRRSGDPLCAIVSQSTRGGRGSQQRYPRTSQKRRRGFASHPQEAARCKRKHESLPETTGELQPLKGHSAGKGARNRVWNPVILADPGGSLEGREPKSIRDRSGGTQADTRLTSIRLASRSGFRAGKERGMAVAPPAH